MVDEHATETAEKSGLAESGVSREMPKYKCHKVVHALKILNCGWTGNESDEYIIQPEDEGYAEFRVSKEYVEKHKPQPGGYYVVYEDGYKSFSPAKAFEQGYGLMLPPAVASTSDARNKRRVNAAKG